MKPAYYNEFDKYAAQWLRNLIAAGHIAPGDVDDRSIEDVRPSDLDGYAQCHFFAGVGVWSYALRRAGWPDNRPVWTGSCPCQPFSEAGQGTGFDDERHLWPHLHHLIIKRRPAIILGEQVASKDAQPWIDLVCNDVEAVDYAFAAVPFPSSGVGAPHIRDRLYWVAHATGKQRARTPEGAGARGRNLSFHGSAVHGLAHSEQHHSGRKATATEDSGAASNRPANQHRGHSSSSVRMADTDHNEQRQGRAAGSKGESRNEPGTEPSGRGIADQLAHGPRAREVNGFWADADWIFCRDGKWRPVEPGTQPLVDGSPTRVGRLRAYGNAINAEAARVFIEAVMECAP